MHFYDILFIYNKVLIIFHINTNNTFFKQLIFNLVY
jgi:hypothetical protein